MKAVIDYLIKPETIWKMVVVIFAMGIGYANLKSDINQVIREQAEIKKLDLNSRMIRIESDVMRIRQYLESAKK